MTGFLLHLLGRMALGCVLIVLLATGLGYVLPPEPEILFTASFNLRDLEIYRMSLPRQLTVAVTHNTANDFLADWSPDGQQIAFVSDRDGNYNIYVTDADGQNTHRMIASYSNQYNPVWSPDGKRIAYVNEVGGYGGVMLYNVARGTTQALTDTYRTHVSPTWSPDGKSITFVSDLDERWNTRIYSVDVATRVVTPILVGSAVNPIWSPDGRYLLYTTGYERVYLYLWDSLINKQLLLYNGNFVSNDTPAWSPDGRSVIYTAFSTNGNSEIRQLSITECLAQPGACASQILTTAPAFYRQPHWRPSQPKVGQ